MHFRFVFMRKLYTQTSTSGCQLPEVGSTSSMDVQKMPSEKYIDVI